MPNPENVQPHQFSKGQSGNPKGRPKGALSRSTIARKWLEVLQQKKNPMNGAMEMLSNEDLITLAQIHKALKGDTQAYKAVMDSAHGQPKAEVKIDYDYADLSDQELEAMIADKLSKQQETEKGHD